MPASYHIASSYTASNSTNAEEADRESKPSICSPHQVFSCVIPLQKNMKPTPCPSACLEHTYTPAVIPAELSPVMGAMMGEGLHISTDGMLSLRIYLESLQYQLVRQWAQTGSELLAELGGHMGLFLGVSVVTVCELVAALGGCLCGAGCRRKSSRDRAGNHPGSDPQEWYPSEKWRMEEASQPQAWLSNDQTLSITIRRPSPYKGRLTDQPSTGGFPN